MNVIDVLNREQLKENLPQFRPGDTVKVYSKVVEGGKERTQMFEGVVIVRKGGGAGESITVRRIAHGVGVEKTFLFTVRAWSASRSASAASFRAAGSTISARRSAKPRASRKRKPKGPDPRHRCSSSASSAFWGSRESHFRRARSARSNAAARISLDVLDRRGADRALLDNVRHPNVLHSVGLDGSDADRLATCCSSTRSHTGCGRPRTATIAIFIPPVAGTAATTSSSE